MKRFIAEDSFWDLFPDARIGILVVDGIPELASVSREDAAEIEGILSRANEEAIAFLPSPIISENEAVAVWREAYQKFKTKKGARSSIENLLKRILKGNPVEPIAPLVDIYNAVSLSHALPVGGEDIDAIQGDLRLGITEGGDAFRALGDEEDAPTLPGELCYRDDAGAVCRCLNWRDGQRTALTDDTRRAIFVIECVDPTRASELDVALNQLASLISKNLGAAVAAKAMITAKNPALIIEK